MVGACLAQGGLVIVTNRLNRILEIDADNMTAVLEPGVITGDFQKAAAKYGLFYPPDPASLRFFDNGRKRRDVLRRSKGREIWRDPGLSAGAGNGLAHR